MDESKFWNLIEDARRQSRGDDDQLVDAVGAALRNLPPAEIRRFDAILEERLRDSYSEPLWGAAYLINGGCSDDGFEYFRGWLVSEGRRVFEAAVAEPDSLADVVDPDADDFHECESLLYVARKTYEDVTGQPMPPSNVQGPPGPAGEGWDFDDDAETAKRLPRLSRMYSGES